MYDRFSEAGRRTIALAEEEARTLGHGLVGTEHLLLGLIAEGEGAAGRSFARLGVTLQAARDRVAAEVDQAPQTPGEPLAFTPRAKGTLEASLRQALGLKDADIDTEHILLALLIERDARTASVLAGLGCPPELLRATVLEERTSPAPHDDGDDLLALAGGSGVAAQALAELGVTPEALAAAVERARSAS
jgi:ATP-dependent Clp protease ATP-binding subunit ClpC